MAAVGVHSSQEIVRQVLSDLKHLDLTGSVEHNSEWPIARGGFGEVFKGTYKRPDGTRSEVAIKRLMVYWDIERDTARIFKREIQAWSDLKHPNVLPLLGYALDNAGDMALALPSFISEWMDNGNVLDFVKNNPDSNIAELPLDMAEGLAYLHENNVVHADFKSANVLISSALEAVICDFGCAHVQTGGTSSVVTGTRGTPRWLAYELLADVEHNPKPTKESDIWAFGMTVYELVTNEFPFAHIRIEAQVILSIMKGMVPPQPSSSLLNVEYKRHLWHICTETWNHDPSQRPRMSEIIQFIKAIPDSAYSVTLSTTSATNQTGVDSVRCEKETLMQSLLAEIPYLELPRGEIQISPLPVRGDGHCDYYLGSYSDKRVVVTRSRYCHFEDKGLNRMHVNAIRAFSMPELQQHPNIQALLGYLWESERDFPLSLVYDFISEQDLSQFLTSNQDANVLQISLEIAQGLACMHDHNLVHGAIRTGTIYVAPSGHPVIGRFYSLYERLRNDSMPPDLYHIRWCAPERLLEDENTKEIDVSGHLEILSGQVPYWQVRRNAEVILRIQRGELPTCPLPYDVWPASRKALWGICKQCWSRDPLARPSIRTVVKMLEGLLAVQDIIDVEEP